VQSQVVVDWFLEDLDLVGPDLETGRFPFFDQVVEEELLRFAELHLGL